MKLITQECLVDIDSNKTISTKKIRGKYGLVWLVHPDHISVHGRFVELVAPGAYLKKGLRLSFVQNVRSSII